MTARKSDGMVLQIARIFTIVVDTAIIAGTIYVVRSDKKNIVIGTIMIAAMMMSIGFVSTW